MSTPPAAPLAEQLHRLIGRSRRVLWMATARCLEARGESVFTWQALCYLVRYGPTVQQDLALANAQDPAGMSRLLDDLEARKLVRRSADPNDRRRSLVEATAQGEAWYRAASPAVVAAADEAMRGLTNAQRRSLKALLEVLLATADAAPRPEPPTRVRGMPRTPRRAPK